MHFEELTIRGRKYPHYFPIYEKYLEKYQGKEIKMLEIGVQSGDGTRMWKQYFPDATIVGVDNDISCSGNKDIIVIIGDQADKEFMQKINDEYGPFDVVLDDGGHKMDQQINSFEVLYPQMNPGGTYIIEDTHTSYWSAHGGGYKKPESCIEYFKNEIDRMHQPYIISPRNTEPTPTVRPTEIPSIHFHDSIIVIDKP